MFWKKLRMAGRTSGHRSMSEGFVEVSWRSAFAKDLWQTSSDVREITKTRYPRLPPIYTYHLAYKTLILLTLSILTGVEEGWHRFIGECYWSARLKESPSISFESTVEISKKTKQVSLCHALINVLCYVRKIKWCESARSHAVDLSTTEILESWREISWSELQDSTIGRRLIGRRLESWDESRPFLELGWLIRFFN